MGPLTAWAKDESHPHVGLKKITPGQRGTDVTNGMVPQHCYNGAKYHNMGVNSPLESAVI